jgi:hypothetical protein
MVELQLSDAMGMALARRCRALQTTRTRPENNSGKVIDRI